ncbi:amidohydrolase family protein [Amycolatopsis sp. cmx-11-51]|uniref:amidohydrolase family protein n=1 Tax=Amycolatopsis sp. cmx-11-51 TaxID=2785797 RepID=UPI0039E571B1
MTKTLIRNVRVFDGRRLSEPSTVVIDGAVFGTDGTGARIVDADGATALPGLIDAHLHLEDRTTLVQLTRWGVTTGLDMATWPAEKLARLRGVVGFTDIRSAGTPAMGPGGPHARVMPELVAEAVLRDAGHAESFVATRLAEGADYLKLILEAPGDGGPDAIAASAFVRAAHRRGVLVVAHAASHGAFALAVELGADIVTHVPLGAPLTPELIAAMAREGTASVPTLTMMRTLADNDGTPQALAGASTSVLALHAAGVPVLAGTDANIHMDVEHGESLHHELELLVDAGLTPVEALRAATCLPAKHFRLPDRGAIALGLRADLVLIDGDPTADVRATRNIRRVWCGGTEHDPFRSD